jgi:transglutaminase-like putative cysteine protease
LLFRRKNRTQPAEKSGGLKSIRRGFVLARNWAGSWIDLAALLLLFLTLYIVFNNIQGAQWIVPQPSSKTVLLLSMATCLVLAKSRATTRFAAGIGAAAGLVVLLWQSSNVLPSQSGLIFLRVARSVSSLWDSLSGSSPSEGTIYFAVFLIVLAWVMGFLCTWLLVRKQNVWYTVGLGFIGLMVNLDYSTFNSYGVFFLYIFVSILLIGFVKIVKQDSSLTYFNLKPRFKGVLWFGISMVIFCAILIGGIWIAPEIRANQIQNLADTRVNVGKAIDNLKLNLFAPVKAKGAIIKSVDQESLYFSSQPNLSTDVQFTIVSQTAPSYWRVRRYDIYNSWGWAVSPYGHTQLDHGVSPTLSASAAASAKIAYTVTDRLKTDIVLSAGQFYSASVPVEIHPFASGSDAKAGQTISGDETASVTTLRIFKPDEQYSVTALVGSPSTQQLSQAGNAYPAWVTTQYLQLPTSLPQSVLRIARSLNRGNLSPYNTVLAVKNYLSQFKYVITGSNPPSGVDEVQDFLSTQKTGNCTNFATAAVVLLRADGIPARLCTGYTIGSYDKSTGTFTVEAKDYHAWPEVYFPGYGWVEFEATPGITPATPDTPAPAPNLPDSSASSPAAPAFDENLAPAPADNSGTVVPVQSNFRLYLTVGIILGLILALVALAIVLVRHYRRMDYASTIYARLLFVARLARLSPKPYQTPLEFGRSLIGTFPEHREAISDITQAYMDSRYSQNKKFTTSELEDLSDSWRSVIKILLSRRFYGL